MPPALAMAADPLHDELTALDATLERLLGLAGGCADPGAALRQVETAQRRLAAVRLKVLAAAETRESALAAGLPTTAAWASRHTQTSTAAAERETRLAVTLDAAPSSPTAAALDAAPSSPTAAALDAAPSSPTAAALDDGALSPEHARIITDALTDLPARLTREQRTTCETRLVAEATRLTPGQLRRAARRALAAVEPDPVVVDAHENDLLATEEDTAWAATALTFHDNGDGTTTGRFTLPHLQAAMLEKALEAMTAPRRSREQRQADLAAGGYDPARARGQAFAALLEHLPTDRLTGTTAAQVVITMDLTLLQGALKVAGLDTDHPITAGQARRLVCSSHLLPAVIGRTLSGASRVLDLGRTARLFNDTQRTALAITHTHCAADGCQRPYAWCELHHREPWSHGGTTDLAYAVPLCHWHHRRIHDHRYRHAYRPDGSIEFTRMLT